MSSHLSQVEFFSEKHNKSFVFNIKRVSPMDIINKDMKDYIYFKRFRETDYAEVVAELQRKDCDGSEFISKLPKESDVEKVMSDDGQVRYALYTKDYIYIVHMEVVFAYDNTNDKDDWTEWDMLILAR